MFKLKEEDVVMCTVKSIEGTTVFVEIEGNGSGSIMMSEVAAGRIRNLREYVAPNKKIVCKVLRINQGDIQLSLRRVTDKEKREIQERSKKEKNLTTLLRAVVKDHTQVIQKIKESFELWDFFDKVKENPSIIESFVKKAEADAIIKTIAEKKEKEKEVKKAIIIRSSADHGVKEIREILAVKGVEIRYLGSSQFMMRAVGKDFKEANHKMETTVHEIEKRAKEKKVFFELKDK